MQVNIAFKGKKIKRNKYAIHLEIKVIPHKNRLNLIIKSISLTTPYNKTTLYHKPHARQKSLNEQKQTY